MTNSYVISNMAHMLSKSCESIEMLVQSTNETDQQAPELSEMYEDMILDELHHVQIMVLELTKRLTGAPAMVPVEGEDSVFAAGELNSDLPVEPTEPAITEKEETA